MADGEQVWGDLEVAEAVDFGCVGAALGGVDDEVVEVGAASAGEGEGGGVAFELEVLHVVVVTGEVEVDLVFAQERLPVADEGGGVAMDAVGEDRVVAHDDEEGRGEGLFCPAVKLRCCSMRCASVSVKSGLPCLIGCGMLLSSAITVTRGFFAGNSKLYQSEGMIQRVPEVFAYSSSAASLLAGMIW